jgi:hypothetical protein
MDYADAPNIWAQEKYHVESFHEPPKPQNPWTKEVIPQNASKRLDACQRCRMRRTKCDRQRPCQRCKYAGINADSCFSDKDQARQSAPEVPDWARDNYIDPEARVREAQGMRYVHASSLVWLEPYKRQMKVTLQCPDYFDGDAEIQILAADDIESVVQAAMLRDAYNTASDNQCPLSLSYMYDATYRTTVATMIDYKTKKNYWWKVFAWQTFDLKGEVEGRRVPNEEEENAREWLGQKQWSAEQEDKEWRTKYVEQGQKEVIELNDGLDLVEVGTGCDEEELEHVHTRYGEINRSLYEDQMLGFMNCE